MNKSRIAILFGGCSPEYEISLQSAAAIIRHINTGKYEPVLIGINREGTWFLYKGDANSIELDTWEKGNIMPVVMSTDRKKPGFLSLCDSDALYIPADAVFPVLHGSNGEDGTVQGMIMLSGIPVIGCNVLSSALCMDKARAHALVSHTGIHVPDSFVAPEAASFLEISEHAAGLGFPLFVKPVRAGSSFGITRITNAGELQNALLTAFQYDTEAIVEKEIPGVEVGCAIIGYEDLIIGEVDEIELDHGFFDYTEKYHLITSKIHVPARITDAKSSEIKQTAKTIYHTLGCSGFARVDMFLTPEGDIYFNEVNTIPGFTTHSRFPGMMRAAGYSFQDVVDQIIEGGLQK